MQNVLATMKGKGKQTSPRLFMLFAREAPTAVIFRRSPSDWVRLIRWNTNEDTIEPGQWFHGRLYERRSDLSPDGSLLIYFAQKINGRTLKDKEYTYAWTAISKPPYLTALALWPKGDCWHGGGSFQTNAIVELNHEPRVATPHPEHEPRGLEIKLRQNVHGEDDPIYSERLERDGWRLQQEWKIENRGYPDLYRTIQPEIRNKPGLTGTLAIQLTRAIEGMDYSEAFAIVGLHPSSSIPIEDASWVDWDQRGRLIIARRGKVYVVQLTQESLIEVQELIDLCGGRPTPMASPEWANIW